MYNDAFDILTKKGEYSYSHYDSISLSVLSVNNIIESITFDWMEV